MLKTLAFVLAFSIAAPCFADTEAEAKVLFDQARKLFDQEKYLEALQKYQESYRILPRSSSLRGIGACQQAMGHNVEAVEAYRKVPEMEGAKESDVQKAKKAIRLLEESVGYLGISGAPNGARVTLDGMEVGTVPLKDTIVLNQGSHILEVSHDDHETLSEKITILPGNVKSFSSVLQPLMGQIAVSCTIGTVSINGVTRGVCPVVVKVKPGEHELLVEASGKKTDVRTVAVTSGKTVSLEIALNDLLPPPATVSTPPPVETVSPIRQQTPIKHTQAFLISGVASLLVGIAGMGVGIGFTVKSEKDYQDVVDIIENANQAAREGDREAYDQYVSQYQTAVESWETDQQPVDRAGMIAGYVIGGTLTVVGSILLGIHGKKKTEKVSVAPGFGGISGSF